MTTVIQNDRAANMNLNWRQLKAAAGSKFARLSILAPLIGWVLLTNNTAAKFLAHFFAFEDLAKPSLNLYVFYLGLFLFGTAGLLYSVFCPSEIALSNSRESFRQGRLQTITPTEAM